jgi:hypothetical protein
MKHILLILAICTAFLEGCTDVCGCEPVYPDYHAFVTNGTGHDVKVRTFRYYTYNLDTVRIIPELNFEIKTGTQKEFKGSYYSGYYQNYPFIGDSVVFEFNDGKVLSFRGTSDWTKRKLYFSHTWKYSPMADSAFTITKVNASEYHGYHTLNDSLYLLAK